MNRKCNYNDHINHISSIIHNRIHRAQELSRFMNKKTRSIFATAHLHSVLDYGAPLMYNCNEYTRKKMHSLHMKCIRFANGSYGFKVSCAKLCKQVNMKTSEEHFIDETNKFVHKVLYNQIPASIINKIKMPRSRANAKLGLKLYPKNRRFTRTLINTIPDVYERIPVELRKTKPSKF